jgi:hypothetical protein
MKVICYQIFKLESNEDVLVGMFFDRDSLSKKVKELKPYYNVGKVTPLYRLAYVLQPHYNLYRNGKRIYA